MIFYRRAGPNDGLGRRHDNLHRRSKMIEAFTVQATPGAARAAVDLVYNNNGPRSGVIEIRFMGDEILARQTEAKVQATEVGPGDAGMRTMPKMIWMGLD